MSSSDSTQTPPSKEEPTEAPKNGRHEPSRSSQTEAHDRAVRFGLVFTQLGAATKEEVFPHGVRHMPRLLTLKEVTEGKLKRQSLEELDAKIRKVRSWWWPFGWFGPPTPEEIEWKRRHAQRKADEALQRKIQKLSVDKGLQVEEAKAAAPADITVEDVAPEPTIEAAKPKRYPLKVEIDPRALTDEEVASLSTSVANQRLGILESEKQLHEMMNTIEKTRMLYLRAAPGRIKCEKEIVSVLSCYEDAKIKSQGGNRAAALRCGPVTDALEQCAREVARAHINQ